MDDVQIVSDAATGEVEWLVVDLDGTLVRADLFVERLCRILVQRPWLLLVWFLHGRWSIASLKAYVAGLLPVDAALLPYNAEVVEHIQEARKRGVHTVLATASHKTYADAVAAHLGLFDAVLATSGSTNLKGSTKLRGIQALTDGAAFSYIGDAPADMPIFRACRQAILVGGRAGFARRVAAEFPRHLHIAQRTVGGLRPMIKVLRPHQWVKNALIVLPAASSLGMYDAARALYLIPAVLLFCACSSFVYVTNDLIDIDADRAHPDKRRRPFASGDLPAWQGIVVILCLTATGACLAALLPSAHLWIFGLYLVLSWLYSARLKELAIIDVFVLAFLYVIRVVAGTEVLAAPYTSWFIIFLLLTFLSLGFLKRHIEVRSARDKMSTRRRAYGAADEQLLLVSGVACIFAGVLVLFLYTTSQAIHGIYKRPEWLLFLGLPYLYFMLDMWRGSVAGRLHHDPVRHVVTSPKAYAAVVVGILIVLISRLGPDVFFLRN